MNGTSFMLLFLLSTFSLNLTLQCALGIKGAAESKNTNRISFMIKLPVIFISIILVWIIISRFFVLMFSGIFIYIILFPLSFMFNEALDFLMLKYILKKDAADESLLSFSGGITAVAAFICVNISNNFLETVILSFGFTSGILLVILFIREIRRRAALEAVPKFIRGKPLVLVSLGLLALVFSVASLFILRMYSFR